jgi:hypothetical protein
MKAAIISFQLWHDNIKYVTAHNGYGNVGDNGVERTDLIEMWGYFIEREYAHKRYGPNHHSPLIAYSYPTTATFANSWYAWNENSGFYYSLFEFGHIPAAFLHDIIDNNGYNRSNGLFDDSTLIMTDNISGYTISSIYNLLDANTTSAASLINKLEAHLPAGINNTSVNFLMLKTHYGY